MAEFDFLSRLTEFLHQATELIPHLRQFFQEFKLLVIDLVALIMLLITAWYLIRGKLVPRSLEAKGTTRDDQVEKSR